MRNANSSESNADSTPVKCPTCRAKVMADVATFPFCSDRCKTVDLGRWFNESYKMSRPIEEADLDEE
ncbi:MAG: DNA gyrase inhibitor YacG [Algisphaera sp.]